ncbi:MAG: flagellar export chaperone FliS [Desulfovermiculus sp.]
MYAYNPYQQSQLQNVPREDLLLQLVEGAIIRLEQAQEHSRKGDEADSRALYIKEKSMARSLRNKAYDIISYLNDTLDSKAEPELVDSLQSLYGYMMREITNSNLKDDFSILDPVIEVMSTLFDGWKDAVSEYKKMKNSSQVSNHSEQARVGAFG